MLRYRETTHMMEVKYAFPKNYRHELNSHLKQEPYFEQFTKEKNKI